MTDRLMRQVAPWPYELEELVAGFHYRPGWTCQLLDDYDRDRGQRDAAGELTPTEDHCVGLTLDIVTLGFNSYHPEDGPTYGVHHLMIVPAATYDRRSWQRWLLEQHLLVDRHEACEFFVVDGEHPFAPNHGPGCDPYRVVEYAADEDRRTSFRGVVNE